MALGPLEGLSLTVQEEPGRQARKAKMSTLVDKAE
jgi:hypothetical protein